MSKVKVKLSIKKREKRKKCKKIGNIIVTIPHIGIGRSKGGRKG